MQKELRTSSYPTYEEWKPFIEKLRTSRTPPHSSYPTYEEWKQTIDQFRTAAKNSSYPTYEEWKPLGFSESTSKK